jgi:hypothetical protein
MQAIQSGKVPANATGHQGGQQSGSTTALVGLTCDDDSKVPIGCLDSTEAIERQGI